MVLTTLAREHGLRVTFTARALSTTPTRHGWRLMAGFGRRQYQMVRMYVPSAFFASIAATLFNLLGPVLPLVMLTVTWRAAIAYGAIVGVMMMAARERTRLGAAASRWGRPAPAERRLLYVALLLPLLYLAHLLMIVAAVRVRKVRWDAAPIGCEADRCCRLNVVRSLVHRRWATASPDAFPAAPRSTPATACCLPSRAR